MKTFYILGTNKIDNLPTPKDFDLFEIEADNLNEAVKVAGKNSNKRYFCSLKLNSLTEENLK